MQVNDGLKAKFDLHCSFHNKTNEPGTLYRSSVNTYQRQGTSKHAGLAVVKAVCNSM